MSVSESNQPFPGEAHPSRAWLRAVLRLLDDVREGLDRAQEHPTFTPTPW
jgi:hypothetical protein